MISETLLLAKVELEQKRDLFDYVRRVVHLHTELPQLKRGRLINLYVATQQYVYARRLNTSSVVIAINNDTKVATIDFAVQQAGLANGAELVDRLGALGSVRVSDGRLSLNLPKCIASGATIETQTLPK